MLIRTHNLAMLTEAKIRNAKPRDGPTLQQPRSLFEIRVAQLRVQLRALGDAGRRITVPILTKSLTRRDQIVRDRSIPGANPTLVYPSGGMRQKRKAMRLREWTVRR